MRVQHFRAPGHLGSAGDEVALVCDLSAKARYGMESQTGFISEMHITCTFNEENHVFLPLIPHKRGRVSPRFPTFSSTLLF